MARLRSNTKISLSVLIDVTADTNQGQAPLHLGGLNLPCLAATKIHPESRRDKGPFSPQSVNHSRVLLRADPTLVTTGIMYRVYKYIPVITAQVITAR